MKVYFSKWISCTLLTVGLICLLLGVWLALLQGVPNGQIAIGAMLLAGSILYLNVPVFSLETDNIALYRPIGSVKQRFPFKAHSEIRIDGGKLFVGKARIPIQKWYLNRSQWQAFEASISH